jgi:hypothetical protein
LKDCRRTFWSVAIFSGGVNLLMLAGPLYMLQVYDRVLSSRSVSTLVALTVLLVGAYSFQAALDLIRSRIVMRAASLLDQHLSDTVHAAVIQIAVHNRNAREAAQPVRDLDQIRAFLTQQRTHCYRRPAVGAGLSGNLFSAASAPWSGGACRSCDSVLPGTPYRIREPQLRTRPRATCRIARCGR